MTKAKKRTEMRSIIRWIVLDQTDEILTSFRKRSNAKSYLNRDYGETMHRAVITFPEPTPKRSAKR